MNEAARPQDRVIRVFISSTFRDMMRERDLLVKEVFPALRRKCAQRFVTFTEVDLRWGITEEQASEGEVLPLCLAEIERSRPYFIGLLGERYGWIPDTIRPEVIAREPWLREHLEGCTSVTELEILHGVLNNPAMRHHAFFYFRDPAYAHASGLTKSERHELVERDIPAEVERFGPTKAARRTVERQARLKSLKQRIRDSGLPVVEPYADPKALAEIIREQLDKLIDELYPQGEAPDALTRERLAHEAHAKHKLFACIDRPAHLAALTEFAERADHGGQGLVVTGESGGGKSALLAAWARDWVAATPDDFLFQHYFGATPDSGTPESFLTRVLGELKQRFGLPEEVPSHPDKLREALPLWLASTPRDVQVTLVLDGLNQIRGAEPDRRLAFLPRHFPPHVTILVSALPGPALDSLRQRGWAEHELPPATEADADAMVAEYFRLLGRFVDAAGRPIATPVRQQLVSAPGSKNLLFLRTVIEELRQFGSFDQLPDRVTHYLEARNPKDLFLRVIRRWQEDFDDKAPDEPSLAPTGGEGVDPRLRERERVAGGRVRVGEGQPTTAGGGAVQLVRRALTHLWAAREGLSEPEWLDLLGSTLNSQPSTINDTPLPRALWTPLFLALEPHLSQRAGLFTYGHDFLRQAVETAFLPSPNARQAAHLTVADYFERHSNQREMTARKAAEWPFQLHAAQAWDRLESCLTDIPLFLAFYNDKTKWELTGYWHPLRQERGRDMGVSYTGAYEKWSAEPANAADHYVPAELGQFLSENGFYSNAEPLLRRALTMVEKALGPEHPNALGNVNNLAQLLMSKGDYTGAQSLFERALAAFERVLGPEHPTTLRSLNNLAALQASKADYAGAQALHERALAAFERVLGPEHPSTLMSLNNLAALLARKGDWAGAQVLHERALAAQQRVLGPEHPDTLQSVNNLAFLLGSQGDHAGAQALHERALEVRERVLGPQHPDTLASVNNLAFSLDHKGDYAGAQPLYERALAASERMLGAEHPSTLLSVNNLANLLASKGDYAGAQPLHERALAASERVLGTEHPQTLLSVNNLARLLSSKGDYAGAQPLYERALEGLLKISQAIGRTHPELQTFLGNYAGCLEQRGHSQERIRATMSQLCQRYGFDLP